MVAAVILILPASSNPHQNGRGNTLHTTVVKLNIVLRLFQNDTFYKIICYVFIKVTTCLYVLPCILQESDEWMEERVDQLVEEVGRMLEVCKDDVVKQMNLVDVLQRLGIDHHFEEQIDTILKNIHRAEFNSSDLYEVALRFRLLRKQGYWVSPGTYTATVN